MSYKNIEKRRNTQREYKRKNKEKIKKSRRKYYQKNKETIRKYQEKNKEKIGQKRKEKYKINFNGCRDKSKVYKIVEIALKQKKLTKPLLCECCKQKKKLEGHHEDYSKPLKVKWLCHICHRKQHKI